MILATCIQKSVGKSDEYTIKDLNGRAVTVTKDQLKKALYDKQIDLDNLKLSKDGRLIVREKGYYKLSDCWCDDSNSKVYSVYRVRANGKEYINESGSGESIRLTEQEAVDAIKVGYLRVEEADIYRVRAFSRLYPISQSEWNNSNITEDRYWEIISAMIRTEDDWRLPGIKLDVPVKSEKHMGDPFIRRKWALLQILLFQLNKGEAIGFCKMSRILHQKYYMKDKDARLPIWWSIMNCSDDSYSDFVYGLIALGKDAFYDFYNNPTKKCFEKYRTDLYRNCCELIGYALTCISEDRLSH